jgi:hypothetical protein
MVRQRTNDPPGLSDFSHVRHCTDAPRGNP